MLGWEAGATPIAAFIAWLYCFGLWLCVEDRSPFHNVGARDIYHLPGVIGVVAIEVPTGRPLRGVEGPVRVGAAWRVEEKLERVRLTAPKMGNKGNKARGQRLVLAVMCWGQLPLRGRRGTTGILRRFSLLHRLWSLVVFARGCLFFSHLWRRNVRQTHCTCPYTAFLLQCLAPQHESCVPVAKGLTENKPKHGEALGLILPPLWGDTAFSFDICHSGALVPDQGLIYNTYK